MPADRDRRASPPKGPVQAPTLDRDEIAARAYQLYQERGGEHGHAFRLAGLTAFGLVLELFVVEK